MPSAEVRQWLDEELRHIRQEADLFRGKFNFAFLTEQAEKRFHRSFSRNSSRLYALKSGYYHALPEEKGKVYTRFETSGPGALGDLGIGIVYTRKRQAQAKGKVQKLFDYLQRRLPYLCEKYTIKDCSEAQKILEAAAKPRLPLPSHPSQSPAQPDNPRPPYIVTHFS